MSETTEITIPKKPEHSPRIGDSLFLSLLQEMRKYYRLVLHAQAQGDVVTEFTLRAVCRALEDELGLHDAIKYYYAMMAPHSVCDEGEPGVNPQDRIDANFRILDEQQAIIERLEAEENHEDAS